MKRILYAFAFLLIGLSVTAQTATVSLGSVKQSIKGFGGMNHPEWVGDLSASQRETAFGNGQGQLGLSILRIFLNDNPNDWNRAVATAKAAQDKGLLVFASPWNPPIALTEVFTKNGDADAKRLKYDSYAAYAQHLIDFITYMKSQGVNLYAISVQNEPDWGSEWTWWTSTEIYNFVKNNVPAIKAAHPDVKIMAAETFGYDKSMTEPILNDNAVLANMDILGVHTYGVSKPSAYPLYQQKKTGKEFWMTEVYHPNSNENSADVWPEALEVGEHIHRCLVDAEMQAYIWWYIRRQYSPMKEDGAISKRGACLAQYSKFVRPGFVRVDVPQNPTTDVYVSAYKKEEKIAVVVINKSTSSKTITISIPGAQALSWQQYTTSATQTLEKGTNIIATTSFQVTLAPQSMATYVNVNIPLLTIADPENLSFDLPLSMDSFQFSYTAPVSSSLAKASMSNGTETFDLDVLSTGFTNKLIFKVPSNKTLINGDYTIVVTDIETEKGQKADGSSSIKLTYGLPQTGTIETILEPQASWLAQRTAVGEGIPLGWKRIQSSDNVDIDVDQNGAYETGSSRMKYFGTGGQFEAGYYFSSRGEKLSRIIYGEFNGYRLHLKPGQYRISFYSAYWETASGISFDFFVKTLQSATVFSRTGLSSTGILNGATTTVAGAKLHEITFDITEEKDYLLEWNVAGGWIGIIFGGIKLEAASSFALQIKDKLAKVIETANTLYTSADTELYRGTIRNSLNTTVVGYANFASTSPTAYNTAIAAVESATAALRLHITNVDTYLSAAAEAKAKVALYNTTTNVAELPALTNYIQAVSTYGNLTDYNNEALLTSALNSLTTAATKLQSQINILKNRINKSLALAKILKTPVPANLLTAAEATIIDDDQVAASLNANVKQYLEGNIAAQTLVFKADAIGTVPNIVDSLDLTGFIKNPNFYTRSQTASFTNGSFPGWANPSFNAQTDASMQPIATVANPLVDSWVSFFNTPVDYFEQTITNLPAGTYDIGFRTRRAPGTITQEQLLDNVHMYVKTNGQTYKQPMILISNRQLPANPNTWIRNLKVTSGASMTLGIRFMPVDGYPPTIFFGDPVLFMVAKNNDVVYSGIESSPSELMVKEVQYFDITGKRLRAPVKGFNLVKTFYTNGKVLVEKVVIQH